MKKGYTETYFEQIKDFDFTNFSNEDWDNIAVKSSRFLTKYKSVELPESVVLCIVNGEPTIVLELPVITQDSTYDIIKLSFTAFCAELNFEFNEEITHFWRKIMDLKFPAYAQALEEHLNKVGL